MKKRDYVEKAKNCILNRVKFHAPILYDGNVDKQTLSAFGVDADFPIFKFEKNLNNKLLKAFELAQKEENFNLLISSNCFQKNKEKVLKKIKNCVVYDNQTSPVSFLETINKMNINYQSSTNYNLKFKDKFVKVADQVLNPNFDDFNLQQTTVVGNFFVDYHEFVLNGNNILLKIQNKSRNLDELVIEMNIPLKKGYYFFKKNPKSIMVENLLTKQKFYLNFICKNAKFCFSNVDGLENSVFACLNVKFKMTLCENEEEFVFFNFGEEKFSLKSYKEIVDFKNLAFQKCCEIFNLKVLTKNPKFDFFFNKTLPKKIWINWLNGEVDEILEQKYITLKRLFVNGKDEISLKNFKEIGLKEVGIFNGEYYKKILVVSGQEKFLRVGRTFFWNINGITNHSLKSAEPMSVCFGEN